MASVTTAESYLEKGKEFTNQGDWVQAVDCYQKAIEENSELYQAYLYLGDTFRYQEEFNQAIEAYEKLIQANTNIGTAYSRLERILEQKNLEKSELEKISNIAKQGLEERPNHTQIRTVFLYSLGALGRIEEAIKVSQKATYTNLFRKKKKFVTEHFDDQKTGQPDFMIIGFMKCATTSLYDYIIKHPQILPASHKEIMFFNNEGLYEMGTDWYRANFTAIPQDCGYVTGEASTLYVQYSKVAERLKASFPNTKLIVVLRNPVDRAISHYHFNQKLGHKSSPLQETVNAEIKAIQGMKDIRQGIDGRTGILSTGLYVYFLEKWLNLFPRNQFLILKTEDLARDTQRIVNQVFDFLGLPNYQVANLARKNQGSYEVKDQKLYNQLTEFYQPYNQKLEEYLGVQFNWQEQNESSNNLNQFASHNQGNLIVENEQGYRIEIENHLPIYLQDEEGNMTSKRFPWIEQFLSVKQVENGYEVLWQFKNGNFAKWGFDKSGFKHSYLNLGEKSIESIEKEFKVNIINF